MLKVKYPVAIHCLASFSLAGILVIVGFSLRPHIIGVDLYPVNPFLSGLSTNLIFYALTLVMIRRWLPSFIIAAVVTLYLHIPFQDLLEFYFFIKAELASVAVALIIIFLLNYWNPISKSEKGKQATQP